MVESKSRRLNVLLISNLFPTPVDPIRGIFTFQLARCLSKMCNLTIVCPLPWFPRWANVSFLKKWGAFSRIPGEYEYQGFKVHSPKYPIVPRLSEAAHAALMFPSLYKRVRRLHRQKPFDAVNTQWLYPDAVAAALTTHLLRLPHVVTALGCDANLFLKQGHKRQQIAWTLRSADGITTVSEALQRFLVREGFNNRPIDAIPNGVDVELFHPRNKSECARRLGRESKGKTVVFVGQLLNVKGIIYLIEAVELLLADGKDLSLYLVGEGDDRPEYEAEIARRGLNHSIFLMGNRPHAEIPHWMGAGDVFCLPSIREGFPNVVLEALFSGRPVVASNVGGIPEMVSEKNGFLVEAENPVQLAQALGKALDIDWDPGSIVASVSHLSWERAAERYLTCIKRATSKKQDIQFAQ